MAPTKKSVCKRGTGSHEDLGNTRGRELRKRRVGRPPVKKVQDEGPLEAMELSITGSNVDTSQHGVDDKKNRVCLNQKNIVERAVMYWRYCVRQPSCNFESTLLMMIRSGKYYPAMSWITSSKGRALDKRRADALCRTMISPSTTTLQDISDIFYEPSTSYEASRPEFINGDRRDADDGVCCGVEGHGHEHVHSNECGPLVIKGSNEHVCDIYNATSTGEVCSVDVNDSIKPSAGGDHTEFDDGKI